MPTRGLVGRSSVWQGSTSITLIRVTRMTLGQTIRIRPTTTGTDFDSALERMAENDSMNSLVVVPIGVVEATLSELKSAGRQASERFVLWLGRPTEGIIQIETIWVPEQESGFDFFKIPDHAMQAR